MNNDQYHLGATSRSRLHFALVLALMATASLSVSVSQIALGLALFVLLFRRFRDRTPLPSTGLGIITLTLAVWALLNIPFSNDPGQSVIFYRRFYLFTVIWVVAAVADSRVRHRWLLAAMLSGSLAISFHGLIRIYRSQGQFWVERLGDMSNPMTSGCLLMMVFLVVIGFILTPQVQGRVRLGLAMAALPLTFALLQTMTRSTLLGAIVGLAMMVLLKRRRLFLQYLAVLVVVIIVMAVLPENSLSGRLPERLGLAGFLNNDNVLVRMEMWQAGWQMIKASPWLGHGDHGLDVVAAEFYKNIGSGTIHKGHLHSNPIMLAVIWGVPGLILATVHFIWQLVLLLRKWRCFRIASPNASPEHQAWILGAIGVWAGFLVAGLTEWYFGDAESLLLYFAIIGVALGPHRTQTPMAFANA